MLLAEEFMRAEDQIQVREPGRSRYDEREGKMMFVTTQQAIEAVLQQRIRDGVRRAR